MEHNFGGTLVELLWSFQRQLVAGQRFHEKKGIGESILVLPISWTVNVEIGHDFSGQNNNLAVHGHHPQQNFYGQNLCPNPACCCDADRSSDSLMQLVMALIGLMVSLDQNRC